MSDTALFLCWKLDHISSYDQKGVSDSAYAYCKTASLSHDKQYVSYSSLSFCQTVSSDLISWPIVGKWQCISVKQSLYIHTNSKWVTVPFSILFCQAVWSHLILWPTDGEWHCHLLSASQSDHMTTASKWQAPSCQAVSWYVTLWLTGSEWHYSSRQSHDMWSYDQQGVSDFLPGTLIISHPTVTNSLWVTVPFFMLCSLSTSHPVTDRKWVTGGTILSAQHSHPMNNRKWALNTTFSHNLIKNGQ